MKVTYDKEMREKAKIENTGLITIDIINAEGFRTTTQIHANEKVLKYAYIMLNRIMGIR